MAEPMEKGSDPAMIETRPSGEFVDGYLAALATLSGAAHGADANTVFYSFDWIGDVGETREEAFLRAVGAGVPGEGAIQVVIEPVAEWRADLAELMRGWLERGLEPALAQALSAELVELMQAFFGPTEAVVFAARASAGSDAGAAALGARHDHRVFETVDGMMLLELSADGA